MNPKNPEYLRDCLSYNPENGALTWKERPARHFTNGPKDASHMAAIWNAKHAGKPAFSGVGNHGYRTSCLGGVRMSAHRVAWVLHYGEWPKGEIDHVNGDRTDNRITNLRDVSRSENARNLSVKSGKMRGVYWYSPTSRWVAKLHHKGRMLHLGYFKDKSEAIAARRAAEREHGFHENHGRAF
jgi:hypothetical protein